MASPSTVITLGFGSFGSVNLLPTLGYGAGEVVVPGSPGLEYSVAQQRTHYALRTASRLHYTTEPARVHYTSKDEDQ